MTKTRKLRKKSKKHKKKIYTKKHYQSGDGMVTSVWGPPLVALSSYDEFLIIL